MAKNIFQASALDGRINQGKADPITSTEKRLVAELREGFEQKFGASRSASRTAKTGPFVTSPRTAKAASKTVVSKTVTGRSASNPSK